MPGQQQFHSQIAVARELLPFLYLASKISLQQLMKTMFISLYVRFWKRKQFRSSATIPHTGVAGLMFFINTGDSEWRSKQ